MATANAAATLERANNFAADYGTATLSFGDGVTVAATHTMAGFTTSNSGNDGLATASAIADETIANSVNPVTQAVLDAGGKTYTLTVGSSGSGADVIVSTTNYISGETSSVTSFVVTFPAV